MKYIVVTTKHHDGFAMYDSKVSDYNIKKMTPFGRDFLLELKNACDKHDILLGAYYSHWLDWEFPGGGLPLWPEMPEDPVIQQPSDAEFENYFTSKCLPQVTELMDRYGIRLFWFDNWCKAPLLTEERLDRLIDLVHSYGGIVNSRIGVTWNHSNGNQSGIDYISMGDNEFPDKTIQQAWETSGTFNESWGYHKLDQHWKSSETLLRSLISNASRNGNYQLNIGPCADGSIPSESIVRLHEIGAWMNRNSESIYKTTNATNPPPSWGRLTLDKNGILYAHIFEPNTENEFCIEDVHTDPSSVSLLARNTPVPFHVSNGKLYFKIPKKYFSKPLTVIRIAL